MSSEKRESLSVGEDYSFRNDEVCLGNHDRSDTLLLSPNSSLSDDEESSFNQQYGPFFIRYSYMATLSLQDLNIGSRGPKFFCHLCDINFHTRLSMITHMKMHGMPFCPACFAMFPLARDVNYHMTVYHPEITQVEEAPVLLLDEMPCVENSYVRMEVPPNSPNHEDGAERGQLGEASDSNNNTMSSLLVEKLREHQLATGLHGGMNDDKPSQPIHHAPDADIQMPTNEANGNARSLRTNDRKSTISGTPGKVHKGSKPKSSPKMTGQPNVGQEERVLKLTSRFGRAINMKIPQF